MYMFFGTGNPNLWSILEAEVELMVFLRMRNKKITKTAKNVPKMRFEGLISIMYMFFGTGNPNLWSILEAEVELMVFLRMRNKKITKTAKNAPKMRFEGLISRMCMFFGTRNLNLWSILKPEVQLMMFLRMRSNKITKNGEKCP
jgi:uncharacterized protein YjhX (UPF0386 family)